MSQGPKSYIILDGFKWPAFGFPQENFDRIRKLDFREGDVVLNTYPKCGTNWTSYMLWEILNQGLPPPQPEVLMERIPFVDMKGVTAFESPKATPRLLTTHIALPYFPFKSTVKYVVTTRNPFDCCVSLHHFTYKMLAARGIPMTFDQSFESFFTGEGPYGDYFDHLLSWYEKRDEPNVLMLLYEEMIQDRKKAVLEVARFLGEEHLRNMEGQTLEKVLEHTSFDYMKAKLDYSNLENEVSKDHSMVLIRKGIVGDWKSCFTESQKLRLKAKMEEKLKGTQLLDYWMKTLNL